MRVLHVIRDLTRATGGPVNALKGLAEAQSATGHSVRILSRDSSPGRIEISNVRMEFETSPLLRSGLSKAQAARIDKLVKESDIVHGHMVWDQIVVEAARAANRNAKPFILRPCGNLESWSMSQKQLKKLLYWHLLGGPLRRAAVIHYTTEMERSNSSQLCSSMSSAVIPIGVLPEMMIRADPQTFFERHPETKRKRIVLFLGRIHPKKQPELLLRSFAEFAKADLTTHLVFAGPDEAGYCEYLRAQARHFQIGNRVSFIGLLNADEAREAYAAASLFALPSQQENFGISIVEAMAAGCPVIVSDRVGVATEISNAAAGLVVKLDQSALTRAIAYILGDELIAKKMGENGRALAIRSFTWPNIAARVLEMYQDAIAKSTSA